MHLRKANYAAARSRHGDAGCEIRLQNQPLAACGNFTKALIQYILRGYSQLGRLAPLLIRKFVHKPRNEPISPVYFYFGTPAAFKRRRIGGHKRLRLNVAVGGILNRRRCAKRDCRLFGRCAGKPKALTALVGAGGYYRRSLGNARLHGGGFANAAYNRSRRTKLTKLAFWNGKNAVGEL